jgi:hypothetical protein
MMATTISNSISEKPFSFFIAHSSFISVVFPRCRTLRTVRSTGTPQCMYQYISSGIEEENFFFVKGFTLEYRAAGGKKPIILTKSGSYFLPLFVRMAELSRDR